jgi:hypothetical protein
LVIQLEELDVTLSAEQSVLLNNIEENYQQCQFGQVNDCVCPGTLKPIKSLLERIK